MSCYVIPLNLWNNSILNKIGRIWGEVANFDDDVCHLTSFKSAKVKVTTKSMELINNVINLECNWKIYPVRVCEEQIVVTEVVKKVCKCKIHQDK